MGNERGKGVILGAGQFQEGVWTHLGVSVEGRKVWYVVFFLRGAIDVCARKNRTVRCAWYLRLHGASVFDPSRCLTTTIARWRGSSECPRNAAHLAFELARGKVGSISYGSLCFFENGGYRPTTPCRTPNEPLR